jgi:hypothetical protein
MTTNEGRRGTILNEMVTKRGYRVVLKRIARMGERALSYASQVQTRVRGAAFALGILLLASSPAMCQVFTVTGKNVQKISDGILSLMQYNLAPEITASSLAIGGGQAGTTGLSMGALGGGFTWSRSFPLYMEGNLSLIRYDPTFILSNGTEQRQIPTRWDSLSGTVGVGLDFPITRELVLRPIVNLTLGRLTSDAFIAGQFIGNQTGQDVTFLENGHKNAFGYGGSVMLDYEHYRRDYEIDVEARLTNIWLKSFGDTSEAVRGSTVAQTLGLWSRWRAPIGFETLNRPVRYVLEYAYDYYFGPNGDILGFNSLNSIGAGIELDTTAYNRIVTRWRLMGRYRFGSNVNGWGVSIAMSF